MSSRLSGGAVAVASVYDRRSAFADPTRPTLIECRYSGSRVIDDCAPAVASVYDRRSAFVDPPPTLIECRYSGSRVIGDDPISNPIP